MRNAIGLILLLAVLTSSCNPAASGTIAPGAPPTVSQPAAATEALPANAAIGGRASASREIPLMRPAGHAIDGDPVSRWDSGQSPPQWIEIDLNNPMDIGLIRLHVYQSVPGPTVHRILIRTTQGVDVLVAELAGTTRDGAILDFLPARPLSGIRYVRIETTAGPAHVSWREIELIQPEAVAQYLTTPTPDLATAIDRLRIETPDEKLDTAFYAVEATWSDLTRPGHHTTAFPLPGDFIVPGGFFDWFFYWDSYFLMTGLVTQGHWQLAKGIVDNFIALIEAYGFVPNYVAPDTVCDSRSQPPYLTAAIQEVYGYVQDEAWLARAYQAAVTEYEGYWTTEPHLVPETGLSRYYDDTGAGCLTTPDTPHFRAVAESGWDNTPRFGSNARQVLPVDLNAQLYRYEVDLVEFARMLGRIEEADQWQQRAEERRRLIEAYFWDEAGGFFFDYDLTTGAALAGTPRCLSAYVTLWAGVATVVQAARLQESLPLFETEHGLASCEPGWADNTQHNYPVGWAYSHWYTMVGLRRYGYHEDGARLAYKWATLVAGRHAETGVFWERFDVVDPGRRPAGRYDPQTGFGWTNGVLASAVARVIFGAEADWRTGDLIWDPQIPPAWQGTFASISLPDYPYPGGVEIECPADQIGCQVRRGEP